MSAMEAPARAGASGVIDTGSGTDLTEDSRHVAGRDAVVVIHDEGRGTVGAPVPLIQPDPGADGGEPRKGPPQLALHPEAFVQFNHGGLPGGVTLDGDLEPGMDPARARRDLRAQASATTGRAQQMGAEQRRGAPGAPQKPELRPLQHCGW